MNANITKEILCNFAKEHCTTTKGRKQLRALITSYCLLNNIEVGSFIWETTIIMLHNITKFIEPKWSYVLMSDYLSRDLI